MTVFGCRVCGSELTVPVSKVALPVHAHQKYGNGPGSLEAVLEPGTYAVDPLPFGEPWRRWEELGSGEAEALGWYAPTFGVSSGPSGRVLLAPGDARHAVIDPALVGDTACCGLDGREPNMVCVSCRTPVATRIDDCGLRHAVWLHPPATHVIQEGPGPHPALDWEELFDRRPGVPALEPEGHWNPMWEAAVASALAHLLAATGGDPIRIPDHRVAGIFQPVLDRLLGPAVSEPELTLVLAGPGLPAAGGDVALVPDHPQTGEYWPVAPPVTPVPLAWDAWRYLAFHRDPKPVGRSVPVPPEAPPPRLPDHHLRPDGRVFLRVLARLPQVRQPRLRAIYERGSFFGYSYYSF
ncbi:hypothetical protein [Actinoplanes sp. NPDC048796]|uniref:hypothetical protein n=1 Tax=unclassified Actinoplanes TaxID=2626549 RepID=UPI0033C67E3A